MVPEQLLLSLREDEDRLHSRFGLEGEGSIYRRVGHHLRGNPGYSPLYGVAWNLLAISVEEQDWVTLENIYLIYRETFVGEDLSWMEGEEFFHNRPPNISPWHLKAMLYCWAYLRDETSLSLEGRRSKEEAQPLLQTLVRAGCFLNMSPAEAESKLKYQMKHDISAKYQRPYLMRASSSVPGLVTLSLVTVLSGKILHIRVTPEDIPLYVEASDLYSSLARLRAERLWREEWYTAVGLMEIMAGQETRMSMVEGNRWQGRLEAKMREMGHPQGVHYSAIALLLRRVFWEKLCTYHMASLSREDRVGLTQSYIAGYEGVETPVPIPPWDKDFAWRY
jgi:hypothetical protein